MFTRFSFSLSRILRLKSRRASKAPAAVPGAGSPPPPPPRSPPPPPRSPPLPPPKKSRGKSLRGQPATSPITQSPQLSPVAETQGTIIVICQDPTRSYVVTEKAPSITGDTARLVVLEPPRRRRVSFADEKARARADSITSSSSSASSSRFFTPVPTLGVDQVPPKPLLSPLPSNPHAAAAASPEAQQWEDIPARGDASNTPPKPSHTKGSKRPMSLFSPRPTRGEAQRFSVPPPLPSKPESLQRRASKRESKRVSGAPGTAKREKRMSRWSREMNRADTQEVLRVLRDMH
ncbi:hypothetical protein BS17DRAFT_785600 [Gyrodon lividus]|nr:hypothetical protein BS17DRAFT_785600 [Gyrodon lividus]